MRVLKKPSGSHPRLEAVADPGSESELIAACIAGERRAQERFYREHAHFVASSLYRVLGREDELDDLVQEVFVIAFRGLSRFRQEAKLSTWMYRICVNVALGKIRSRKRKPPPILKEDPVEATPELSPMSPEAELSRAQERARVYRILERIAPKKRIVLYLHEIEGHSLKDIAYLVEANPVTVRTRLYYARKEFHRLLTEEGM